MELQLWTSAGASEKTVVKRIVHRPASSKQTRSTFAKQAHSVLQVTSTLHHECVECQRLRLMPTQLLKL